MTSPTSLNQDEILSVELTRRCEAARAFLYDEMFRLGLTRDAGWRIADKIRFVQGRTEIVFWPVHPHIASPKGLECVVSIDESATELDSTCEAAE